MQILTFETFYNNDSQYARTGSGPLLNQPNSISTMTRPPRSGFKGNEGYGAPDDVQVNWPSLTKNKKRSRKKKFSK